MGEDANPEWLMLDSTVIHAYQHAAIAPINKGPESSEIGSLEGQFFDQASAAADTLGNPSRLLGGRVQENDMVKGQGFIDGIKPGTVLADRAYGADRLMDSVLDAGAEPVIPPRRHHKHQRAYDMVLYKERNTIERFFNKLK